MHGCNGRTVHPRQTGRARPAARLATAYKIVLELARRHRQHALDGVPQLEQNGRALRLGVVRGEREQVAIAAPIRRRRA